MLQKRVVTGCYGSPGLGWLAIILTIIIYL